MRFAIDVGVTTAAALDADRLEPVRLSDEPGASPTAPSAVTWARDGSRSVGDVADRRLDAAPRSGVRGALALLSSGAAVAELAAGPVPVVALVAALLEHARTRAEHDAGGPVPSCALTIPVGWAVGGRQVRALSAAAALAGLPDSLVVVPAPLAAAGYLDADGDSGALAICDLGGTTCQLAVVDDHRLLAARQLTLGTDTLDESLYIEVLRLLGESAPDAAAQLEGLLLHPAAADAELADWRRCQVELARLVRSAREELVAVDEVTVRVPDPVGVDVRLGRSRLVSIAEQDLGTVAGGLREQLARVAPDVRRCVLIGGGAAVPGFAELMAGQLEASVEVAGRPELVVALGAASYREEAATGVARAPRGPGRAPKERVLADDVCAAAVDPRAGIVAAVVRDSGRVIAWLDGEGQRTAEGVLHGGEVRALHPGDAGVLAQTEGLATLFDGELRPLAARRDPLAVGLAGRTAWIVHRGGGDDEPPSITTYAISAGVAATVAAEPLIPASGSRRSGWRPRRGGHSPILVPSCAMATTDGAELLFAVPAAPGVAAQLLGRAHGGGLAEPVELRAEPPWTAAVLVAGEQTLTLGATAPAAAHPGWWAGPAVLSGAAGELWSDSSARATVAQVAATSTWLLTADDDSWTAWCVDADGVHRRGGGAGSLISACAGDQCLWLIVAGSDGVRLEGLADAGGPHGSPAPLSSDPFSLIGVHDGALLALRGPASRPRRLVALATLT